MTHFRISKWWSAAIGLALVMASSGPAFAQFGFLYSWNRSTDGSYAVNGNWSPVGVPDAANEGAQFDVNATYNVSIANNYTVGDLNVYQGHPTFALQPPGLTQPALIYTAGGLGVTAASASPSLAVQDGNMTITGNTIVDAGGSATLSLANATLTTASTTLGATANAAGILSIDPVSTWNSSASATIGDSGRGELDMYAGTHSGVIVGGTFVAQSAVTTAGAVLGKTAAGNGTANVYGFWHTGDLTVGNSGAGTINILSTTVSFPFNLSSVGRLLSAAANIAAQPGSSGSVNVAGAIFGGASDWQVTGGLGLGGTLTTAGGAGTLAIGLGNAVDVGANLKMWPGGKIDLTAGGTLAVTGVANLNGNLSFSLLGTPHSGDSFQVLSASGGVVGTFASTTLPALDSGLAWNVVYAPTSVSLTITQGLVGDFNSNGAVDTADYDVWRKYQGTTHTLANDPAGGTIGSTQYGEWRSHFGQTGGSGAGSLASGVAVPEPMTLLLAIAVVSWVLTQRATRRVILHAPHRRSS